MLGREGSMHQVESGRTGRAMECGLNDDDNMIFDAKRFIE